MRLALRTALVLALGLLITLGLAAAEPGSSSAAQTGEHDETALVASPDTLPAAAARLDRGPRQELPGSQRGKDPLTFVAVVTASLVIGRLSSCRACDRDPALRPMPPWRFRSAGRAPPTFRLSAI